MAVVGVISPHGLDERARGLVAGVWAFRARSEREASARFERLAAQLEAEHAAPVVVAMAKRAADDEVRHVQICADLAVRYGHRGGGDEPTEAGEIGPRRVGGRERLLYEVVAFCAVTESINAALMTVSYEQATDAVVRAAVREILRDEVTHARLGWAHLSAERALGGGAQLAAGLPAMLAGTVREELFAPTDGEAVDARLAGHGELPRAVRVEVFVQTLEAVVFPGLEAHGVDATAGRAWLARARSGLRAGAQGPDGSPTRMRQDSHSRSLQSNLTPPGPSARSSASA